MPAPQLFFADLVRESITAGGTAALPLAGALPGHRRFADAVPTGALFHYAIAGVAAPGEWETGTGRIDAQGRLERVSIAASSAGAGAATDFSPGLKTAALTVGAGWFAAASQPPALAEISGLADALATKQPAGSYAPATHDHALTAVTGLQTALNARHPLNGGFAGGSADAPGISFSAEAGSGLYRSGAGAVDITTAGVRRISISASGLQFNLVGMGLLPGIKASHFGYSIGYPALVVGDAAGTRTLALNYDPAGNPSGSFAGNGSEILVRNGAVFVTPNAANSGYNYALRFQDGELIAFGKVRPDADNAHALGTAAQRWTALFAASGTISTSDERDKRDIEPIPEEWLDAWGKVEWCRYRFVGGSRWHIGAVAQRVHAAFAKQGVDAFAIGLLCRDALAGTDAALNERRADRWGLRYDECFAIEAAWQRRELSRLKAPKRRARTKVAAA